MISRCDSQRIKSKRINLFFFERNENNTFLDIKLKHIFLNMAQKLTRIKETEFSNIFRIYLTQDSYLQESYSSQQFYY